MVEQGRDVLTVCEGAQVMGVGQPELVCTPGTLKQINLVAVQTKAKLCNMAPVCTAKPSHASGEGGHVQTAHQAWDWRGSVPSLAWCRLAMPWVSLPWNLPAPLLTHMCPWWLFSDVCPWRLKMELRMVKNKADCHLFQVV